MGASVKIVNGLSLWVGAGVAILCPQQNYSNELNPVPSITKTSINFENFDEYEEEL